MIHRTNIRRRSQTRRNPSQSANRASINPEHTQQYQRGYSRRLCCRKNFINNQSLERQAVDVQYKHYTGFPWKPYEKNTLAKCICAFLNTSGGNIYIGVKQERTVQTTEWLVKGKAYSQTQKQEVQKSVTSICSRITPNIVVNQFCKVSFVPIANSQKVVIKISVNQGNSHQLYSIYNHKKSRKQFFSRTPNQVIRIPQNDIEDIILQRRLGTKIDCLYPHQNSCSSVHLSQQSGIYSRTSSREQHWTKEIQSQFSKESFGNKRKKIYVEKTLISSGQTDAYLQQTITGQILERKSGDSKESGKNEVISQSIKNNCAFVEQQKNINCVIIFIGIWRNIKQLFNLRRFF